MSIGLASVGARSSKYGSAETKPDLQSSSLVLLVLAVDDDVGVRIGEIGLRAVLWGFEGNALSRCWASVVGV